MEDPPPYRRALVVINPVAGQHEAEATEEALVGRLEAAGTEAEVRHTTGEGDAHDWAEAAEGEGFDLLVVAGGDGTVKEAASGLVEAQSRLPLAQIPMGTANLFARALHIPADDPAEAMDALLAGRALPLDVGYLPERGEYFVLMVGAGYDARLVKDASRELKNWLSHFAYVLGGLKNLFTLQSAHVELEIDGERRDVAAHTVLLLNVGNIGSSVEVDPGITPVDGKIDLAFISSPSPWDALKTLYQIVTRRAEAHGHVEYAQAERVRFGAAPSLPIHVDGELAEGTPLAAEIIPEGAVFVVPEGYAP
jgi:YegS/Rv2252/BmrU family lipid kinase